MTGRERVRSAMDFRPVDIAPPDIHRMADMIVDRCAAEVELAIKTKAYGIGFGDDYGTERGLLMSPEMWRRFFKPRLSRLFKPAREAGLDVVFHSCGKLMELLPDLREVGATAIWPQLPAFNMAELARRCRELGLSVAVHTDRANAMTYGKPQDVKDLVKCEYETFGCGRAAPGSTWRPTMASRLRTSRRWSNRLRNTAKAGAENPNPA